jgi:hypothetical protein
LSKNPIVSSSLRGERRVGQPYGVFALLRVGPPSFGAWIAAVGVLVAAAIITGFVWQEPNSDHGDRSATHRCHRR